MARETVTEMPPAVPVGQTGTGAMQINRARIWRALWVRVHLYLGLVVGALLVVFGLTGSVLVFWQEIDERLNPDLLTVRVPSPGQDGHRPLGEMLAAAMQAAAPGSRVTQVYGATARERVFAVYVEQPSKAWQRIFIDPYRASVTGVRSYGADEWVPEYFMDAVFALHFQLFIGVTGVTVAAVSAWLLMLSLMTGLIVWWPVNGRWRQAFVIRRPATPFRFLFDLHKTLSFYLCLAIGAVLLSGAYMNWAEPIVWVTQLFSPATRGPAQAPQSKPLDGGSPISPEQAVALAAARYPEGRLSSISMPEDATGVYQVGRQAVPGLSNFWSERIVSIDQYSGALVDVRAPDTRRSAGETFLDWQWPLHSGQAFGMPGRLLVFVSGLACPVIYATGFLMWWRKRRGRKRAHTQQA
ncbi:MAG: conserved membrane protein of unknown function [Nitrospira sp.]|nr:MAG: conserved membrane protein of unknown function [Nitrospira sp.]